MKPTEAQSLHHRVGEAARADRRYGVHAEVKGGAARESCQARPMNVRPVQGCAAPLARATLLLARVRRAKAQACDCRKHPLRQIQAPRKRFVVHRNGPLHRCTDIQSQPSHRIEDEDAAPVSYPSAACGALRTVPPRTAVLLFATYCCSSFSRPSRSQAPTHRSTSGSRSAPARRHGIIQGTRKCAQQLYFKRGYSLVVRDAGCTRFQQP